MPQIASLAQLLKKFSVPHSPYTYRAAQDLERDLGLHHLESHLQFATSQGMKPEDAIHYLKRFGINSIQRVLKLKEPTKKLDCDADELRLMINLHGIGGVEEALRHAGKHETPLWLAISSLGNENGPFRRHDWLVKLSNALHTLDKSTQEQPFIIKPVRYAEPYPSGHGHLFVLPTPEAVRRHPSAETLDELTGTYPDEKGALGFVSFSVLMDKEKPVLVINDIQYRKFFFRLSSQAKNQFSKWYKRAIDHLIGKAKSVGITTWHIVTPQEAEKAIEHPLPSEPANQFYVRTPNKMGLTNKVDKRLTDPLSGETHRVQVWE